MKISTKGRYGLRLMTDLAVYHDQGLIPLKEIAARQEISEKSENRKGSVAKSSITDD